MDSKSVELDSCGFESHLSYHFLSEDFLSNKTIIRKTKRAIIIKGALEEFVDQKVKEVIAEIFSIESKHLEPALIHYEPIHMLYQGTGIIKYVRMKRFVQEKRFKILAVEKLLDNKLDADDAVRYLKSYGATKTRF